MTADGGSTLDVTGIVTVWHDEADRLATWGFLDPADGCMCRDCVLPDNETAAAQ